MPPRPPSRLCFLRVLLSSQAVSIGLGLPSKASAAGARPRPPPPRPIGPFGTCGGPQVDRPMEREEGPNASPLTVSHTCMLTPTLVSHCARHPTLISSVSTFLSPPLSLSHTHTVFPVLPGPRAVINRLNDGHAADAAVHSPAALLDRHNDDDDDGRTEGPAWMLMGCRPQTQ